MEREASPQCAAGGVREYREVGEASRAQFCSGPWVSSREAASGGGRALRCGILVQSESRTRQDKFHFWSLCSSGPRFRLPVLWHASLVMSQEIRVT